MSERVAGIAPRVDAEKAQEHCTEIGAGADMNETLWIAVAGIAGTLAAPLLAERLRHRTLRADRLHAARVETYADLLEAAARVTENARTWAAVPLADLNEHASADLDRMLARVRVISSKRVYDEFTGWRMFVARFHQELFQARVVHHRVQEAGEQDRGETIAARLELADLSAALIEKFQVLESAIRAEIGN